jgi:hypothetical protein
MPDSSKVMGKWGKAYLPTWLITLRYSSVTSWKTIVSNMIPVTHHGKSRLKRKQSENQRSWKSSVGGCGTVVWADPPQAPPTDFRKTIVQGVYSFSWIIAKKLDKQIKNDRPPYNRIIENPNCAYSYYTKAEPACGFSGDQGKPQCTHALNHYARN